MLEGGGLGKGGGEGFNYLTQWSDKRQLSHIQVSKELFQLWMISVKNRLQPRR